MWLSEGDGLRFGAAEPSSGAIDSTAVIEPGVLLNETGGPIEIGARTRICAGAVITGPVRIGADCFIGTRVVVRGLCVISDYVRIGHSTEIRQMHITAGSRIGPQCSLRGRLRAP